MATNHSTQHSSTIDPKTLAGKRAVVTGGTIGMGRAIVQALTDRGAEVMYTGRSDQRLAEAQAALDTPLAHPVRSDATDAIAIAALRDQVADRLGGIDYLFINQGIAEFQTLEEVTEESWDRIFNVNAKGAFFTVQRLAPLMSEGGSIVFTTVSNDQIFPGLSAYSGAKEAVAAFAKVLATELLPRKIRVNAIAPGFILTPTMGVAELTDEQRTEFIEQGNASTPMGRGGTVEEVATAALYLAVEATFTTGVELPVDGGFGQGSATPTGDWSPADHTSVVPSGGAVTARLPRQGWLTAWRPRRRDAARHGAWSE